MPFKSLNDLIINEVRDMYSAEKQVTKALPQMAKAATNPKLTAAFEQHMAETEQQIEMLEEIFSLLGVEPRAKMCKGMEGLLAEGEDILKEKDKAHPATLDAALIASAQKVEHYEIASYGTVREWAEVGGQPEVAQIIDRILEQESMTNEKLTKIASSINPDA